MRRSFNVNLASCDAAYTVVCVKMYDINNWQLIPTHFKNEFRDNVWYINCLHAMEF